MSRKGKSKAPRYTVMEVMVKFCGDNEVHDLAMIAQAIRRFDRKDRPFHELLCYAPSGVEQEEVRDLRLSPPAIKFRLVRGNLWHFACLECIKDGKGRCRKVLRILNGKERRDEASGFWWQGHERGTDPRRFLRERDLPVMAERA
jgi:hypothetical protein